MHASGYRKLGKTTPQRKALLRNQVTNLLYHGKIKTTETRAKEVKRIAEKLITLAIKEKDNFEEVTVAAKVAKKDAKRAILAYLYPVTEVPADGKAVRKNTKKVDMAAKMFDEIAPKYAGRNGGYTRIVKLGARKGDGAMEVILELV